MKISALTVGQLNDWPFIISIMSLKILTTIICLLSAFVVTPWQTSASPSGKHIILQSPKTASWYDSQSACRFNPDSRCPTASGRSLYDLEAQGVDFAAMYDVPLGSSWWVCHAELPTRCVKVVVWDRGPAKRLGRVIDLSKSAYQKLAALSTGVIPVTIQEAR